MTWFEATGALALSAILLVGLGAPLAWVVGSRGIAFVALSIGTSVSSVTITAFMCGFIHVPWTVGPPVALSLIVAAIALPFRRWLRPPADKFDRREWRSTLWISVAAAAVGALVIGGIFVSSNTNPEHQSQTYDAIFHLNAVRWILDTGDASPLHMTMSTPGLTTSFYPTIWHAFVVIVVQLTGVTIPVAANSFTLVICMIVWPVACVFLARTVFGAGRLMLVSTGVLSACFAAFPSMLMWYGELYPNLFATALMPIGIGLLFAALVRSHWTGMRTWTIWVAFAWVLLGMTMAHPNALFAMFALTVPLVGYAAVRFVRTRRDQSNRVRRAILATLAVCVVLAIEAFVWTRFGTSDNVWPPHNTIFVAFAKAVLNAPAALPLAIPMSLLVLIGAVRTLLVRRWLWLSLSYAISVGLYVVCTGWPAGHLRTLITGLWFNDSYRLGAMLPIFGIPLAAIGLVAIIRLVISGPARLSASHRPSRTTIAVIVVLCLSITVVTAQLPTLAFVRLNLHWFYVSASDSPVVSPDELAVFQQVRRLTPRDAVIAGNPWNGSSLVYAYANRRALFPHTGGDYPKSYLTLAEQLKSGTPQACSIANNLGVDYVLDFGTYYVFPGDPRANKYPGLTDVQGSGVLTLIASEGSARLYKVTGC